jgi:GNAT superfamily N-acetyltransferase
MAARTDARAHDAAVRIAAELTARDAEAHGGEIHRRLRAAEASAEDAALLHALLTEFAVFEQDEMVRTAEELQHDMGAGWFGCVFLETVDATPMGFTCYSIKYSTFHGPSVYMIDLFVREQFRSAQRGEGGSGGGHGKLLMQFNAAIALDQGCERLDWHVDSWNDKGRAFYLAQGGFDIEQQSWRIVRTGGGLEQFVAKL